MDEFEAINGVGASEVDTLHEAGYECIEDIQAASQSEFSEINGIGKALATRIESQRWRCRSQQGDQKGKDKHSTEEGTEATDPNESIETTAQARGHADKNA